MHARAIDHVHDHCFDWTPLHYALSAQMPEIAIELIEKGADPHQSLPDGDTALHFARNKKIIKK